MGLVLCVYHIAHYAHYNYYMHTFVPQCHL